MSYNHSMNLTEELMRRALQALDAKLKRQVRLIIGGGGAMILAHHFPLATTDIDGIPGVGTTAEELDPLIKEVAEELHIPKDWLNPYYVTFTHVLPPDYNTRLKLVFELSNLIVEALSKEDLLIMKCFAGRIKDHPHVKALIQSGANISLVETHIESLNAKGIPGAAKALDFLDEVLDTA
jgi:hypothetical protein